MVDPKNTNERTVETDAGPELAASKVWVKPRLETFGVDETALHTAVANDGGGAGSCLS